MPSPGRARAMFPLGSVLFPHAVLPLQVFEPRYRTMMQACLDGDGEFAVVLIERGSEVGGGDVRFDVGTVASIVEMAELPDGRLAVVAIGIRRVRVERWMPDGPYPQAEVVELEEPGLSVDDGPARDRVIAALDVVVQLWRQLDPRLPETLPAFSDDPIRAVWELAAAAPIEALDAQRVLAAPNTRVRADLLGAMLGERADELRGRLALE